MRTDQKISQEELEDAFQQCDELDSGFIEISKLKIVLRALGFEPRQSEIDDMTKHLLKNEKARGLNKDAFTIEELSDLLEKKIDSNITNEQINSTFKLFDFMEKGYIDFEDLKRISVELGENLSDEELKEMISEADSTRSGHVSENDFEKVMKKTALY